MRCLFVRQLEHVMSGALPFDMFSALGPNRTVPLELARVERLAGL